MKPRDVHYRFAAAISKQPHLDLTPRLRSAAGPSQERGLALNIGKPGSMLRVHSEEP
jgi:hypothetical protein